MTIFIQFALLSQVIVLNASNPTYTYTIATSNPVDPSIWVSINLLFSNSNLQVQNQSSSNTLNSNENISVSFIFSQTTSFTMTSPGTTDTTILVFSSLNAFNFSKKEGEQVNRTLSIVQPVVQLVNVTTRTIINILMLQASSEASLFILTGTQNYTIYSSTIYKAKENTLFELKSTQVSDVVILIIAQNPVFFNFQVNDYYLIIIVIALGIIDILATVHSIIMYNTDVRNWIISALHLKLANTDIQKVKFSDVFKEPMIIILILKFIFISLSIVSVVEIKLYNQLIWIIPEIFWVISYIFYVFFFNIIYGKQEKMKLPYQYLLSDKWKALDLHFKVISILATIVIFLKVVFIDFYIMINDTLDLLVVLLPENDAPDWIEDYFVIEGLLQKLAFAVNETGWLPYMYCAAIILILTLQSIFSPSNILMKHIVEKYLLFSSDDSDDEKEQDDNDSVDNSNIENNRKQKLDEIKKNIVQIGQNTNWASVSFKVIIYIGDFLQNILLILIQQCYIMLFNMAPPLSLLMFIFSYMLFRIKPIQLVLFRFMILKRWIQYLLKSKLLKFKSQDNFIAILLFKKDATNENDAKEFVKTCCQSVLLPLQFIAAYLLYIVIIIVDLLLIITLFLLFISGILQDIVSAFVVQFFDPFPFIGSIFGIINNKQIPQAIVESFSSVGQFISVAIVQLIIMIIPFSILQVSDTYNESGYNFGYTVLFVLDSFQIINLVIRFIERKYIRQSLINRENKIDHKLKVDDHKRTTSQIQQNNQSFKISQNINDQDYYYNYDKLVKQWLPDTSNEIEFYQDFLTQLQNTAYCFIPGIGAFIANLTQFMNSPSISFNGKMKRGMRMIDYLKNVVGYIALVLTGCGLFFNWEYYSLIPLAFAVIIEFWDAWREGQDVVVPEEKIVHFPELFYKCIRITQKIDFNEVVVIDENFKLTIRHEKSQLNNKYAKNETLKPMTKSKLQKSVNKKDNNFQQQNKGTIQHYPDNQDSTLQNLVNLHQIPLDTKLQNLDNLGQLNSKLPDSKTIQLPQQNRKVKITVKGQQIFQFTALKRKVMK